MVLWAHPYLSLYIRSRSVQTTPVFDIRLRVRRRRTPCREFPIRRNLHISACNSDREGHHLRPERKPALPQAIRRLLRDGRRRLPVLHLHRHEAKRLLLRRPWQRDRRPPQRDGARMERHRTAEERLRRD